MESSIPSFDVVDFYRWVFTGGTTNLQPWAASIIGIAFLATHMFCFGRLHQCESRSTTLLYCVSGAGFILSTLVFLMSIASESELLFDERHPRPFSATVRQLEMHLKTCSQKEEELIIWQAHIQPRLAYSIARPTEAIEAVTRQELQLAPKLEESYAKCGLNTTDYHASIARLQAAYQRLLAAREKKRIEKEQLENLRQQMLKKEEDEKRAEEQARQKREDEKRAKERAEEQAKRENIRARLHRPTPSE